MSGAISCICDGEEFHESFGWMSKFLMNEGTSDATDFSTALTGAEIDYDPEFGQGVKYKRCLIRDPGGEWRYMTEEEIDEYLDYMLEEFKRIMEA